MFYRYLFCFLFSFTIHSKGGSYPSQWRADSKDVKKMLHARLNIFRKNKISTSLNSHDVVISEFNEIFHAKTSDIDELLKGYHSELYSKERKIISSDLFDKHFLQLSKFSPYELCIEVQKNSSLALYFMYLSRVIILRYYLASPNSLENKNAAKINFNEFKKIFSCTNDHFSTTVLLDVYFSYLNYFKFVGVSDVKKISEIKLYEIYRKSIVANTVWLMEDLQLAFEKKSLETIFSETIGMNDKEKIKLLVSHRSRIFDFNQLKQWVIDETNHYFKVLKNEKSSFDKTKYPYDELKNIESLIKDSRISFMDAKKAEIFVSKYPNFLGFLMFNLIHSTFLKEIGPSIDEFKLNLKKYK